VQRHRRKQGYGLLRDHSECAAANIAVFFGLMSLVCAALIVIGYSI
jgi:hypothetical protein